MNVNKHPRIVTGLQFLVWWMANSLYAVDAQTLLRNFSSHPMMVIDLSFFQIVVGMAMAYAINIWRNPAEDKNGERFIPRSGSSVSVLALTIGFLHISATILTNFSYLTIGSTTTLMWKLTEPCAAVILKQLILEESTNAMALTGVLFVVAGVLTYSLRDLNMLVFSPIILANVLFPTRNVVVKLDQKNQSEQISTGQRYFMLLFSSMPFCLFALAVKLFFERPVFAAFPFLIRNAILFNAYQFASIALLEKLDALTHSLANMMKRFIGILLSALMLGEHFTQRHVTGLLLTTIGFPLYFRAGKSGSSRRLGRSALPIVILATALIFFVIQYTLASHTQVVSLVDSITGADSVTAADPVTAADSFTERALNKTKTISESNKQKFYMASLEDKGSKVFIMAKKYVSAQKESYAVDKNDVFSFRGHNLGNLVWEHAAYDMLPDFSSSTVCAEVRYQCFRDFTSSSAPKQAVAYWATANIFNEAVNRSFSFFMNSAKSGDQMIIIGAGIQADFGEEDKDIKDPDEQRRIAVERFSYSPPAQELLNVLQNYSHPVMMRGEVTLQTARRAGYTHGVASGCPSLFINTDVRLGQTMEAKYAKLKDRIGDKSLKIGINFQTAYGMAAFFMRIYQDYPNSIFFAQGSNDVMFLKRVNVDKSRVRMYSDIQEWKDGIREMDVVFGARIHGSMIALGASVPIFVVAPDYRVLELVQRMKIPHMTIHDERLKGDFDVAEVVYSKRIIGDAFDRNRCGIAKIYRRTFAKYGFGVASHVRQISEMC